MKITPHSSLFGTEVARMPVKTGAPRKTTSTTDSSTSGGSAGTSGTTETSNPFASWVTATAPPAAPTAPAAGNPPAKPGIGALVAAIMNGSFQPAYVTDPKALEETDPLGTTHMPSTYYLSDASAQQLAQLLGGKVIQKPAFPVPSGYTDPKANFIQLPSGQTVNAADLAYYARCGNVGVGQLTADITQEINQGGMMSNYYDALQASMNGTGPLPSSIPTFQPGEVGPPIQGMTYPAGTLDANGNVINPAFIGVNP